MRVKGKETQEGGFVVAELGSSWISGICLHAKNDSLVAILSRADDAFYGAKALGGKLCS